ncbi:hypothetical protein FD14_GL002080 [Secundilactobacillus similis DSM 23365 = JCM 2765]|uniref:Uncharacterized protein n=2 Tax=Secundilactobacillus similis TaxID=414682 RepID=A0A0R2EPS0_9LACO|nr:hypothetical protein FD14_GL002080 [Secundilactobacillus similis DSM 23365 = JCM 2765]
MINANTRIEAVIMDQLTESQLLKQLNQYSQEMEQFSRDTREFALAVKAYNQLLDPLNVRDELRLVNQLGRPLTNAELAKLILAARDGKDVFQALIE